MKNIKDERGITLIALAVTIVVILILAGVTIDAVFSENGIINKAKEAANAMNNAVANDQAELNDLLEELNEIMNSEWNNNIEIPDPEPEKPPKLEDTTGMQDKTIKVEDEFGNIVTIPKGFEVVEEEGTTVPGGIVIQDKDKNQFVWIPVGKVYKDNTGENFADIKLGRYTFDKSNGTPTPVQYAYTEEEPEKYKQAIELKTSSIKYIEYATRENPDGKVDNSNHLNDLNAIAENLGGFVESVKIYGGYYLGRYEASYGSGDSIDKYKPLSKVSRSTNFSTATVGSLWNNVTQIDAAKISRNMYDEKDNVGVESDLVNSYAWDTAIVFIQAMGNGNENYANKTSVNSSLANTGTTGDEVCNIHDMASNCIEWSTEYSTLTGSGYAFSFVHRGGSYNVSGYYTAFRHSPTATRVYSYFSFRVSLYVK